MTENAFYNLYDFYMTFWQAITHPAKDLIWFLSVLYKRMDLVKNFIIEVITLMIKKCWSDK